MKKNITIPLCVLFFTIACVGVIDLGSRAIECNCRREMDNAPYYMRNKQTNMVYVLDSAGNIICKYKSSFHG